MLNFIVFLISFQMMEADKGWQTWGRPTTLFGRWILPAFGSTMVLWRGRLLPLLFPLRKNGRHRLMLNYPLLLAVVLLCSIQGDYHCIPFKHNSTNNIFTLTFFNTNIFQIPILHFHMQARYTFSATHKQKNTPCSSTWPNS